VTLTRIHISRLLVFWGVIGLILFTGLLNASVALFAGIVMGLTIGNPYPLRLGSITSLALKVSVVGLGFGINLYQVSETGTAGFFYTAFSLVLTMLLGALLARVLGIHTQLSHLISTGTAICGGSAIAAVAPAVKASSQDISVALGIVFILNAAALFIFPFIGYALTLSQVQFGTWAAIAIHDTSSVVGAAAQYGAEALEIATTLKLTRALWIIPMVFITGLLSKSEGGKNAFPLFILFFLAASVLNTFVTEFNSLYPMLVVLARKGLLISLFLTGAGINLALLRSISLKPFVQGFLLWLLISIISLLAVYFFL
jgi:uncharacterized integral membrane protein (TIGR00698 family)